MIEDAGHQVHHVFSEYTSAQTQRKRRFWPDAAGIKGCTVHNCKGWETRALVKGGQSFLSVVNGDVAIAGFESTFTRSQTAVRSGSMLTTHFAQRQLL